MDTFESNLEALKRLLPQEHLSLLERSGSVPVELQGGAIPTLLLAGRVVHSSRAPEKEAVRLFEHRPELRHAQVVVFLGFGLGYHLEAFLEMNHYGEAWVLEPAPEVLLHAARARSLTHILSSDRVKILLPSPDVPKRLYHDLLGKGSEKIFFHSLPAYAHAFPDEAARLASLVNRIRETRRINRFTIERFGRRWIRNILVNLPWLLYGRGIELLQNELPYPTLLLAAGPTLDQIGSLLPDLARRCIVVATDTASGWAVAHGVEPDFVVIVDPQYWNTRHLDHLGRGTSLFIMDPAVYPSLIRRHASRSLFTASPSPLAAYLSRWIPFRARLGAGGSVSTTAWDFCRYIGSNRIFCAGLDLAFPGGRTYYRGSLYERLRHSTSWRLNHPIQGETLALWEAGADAVETEGAHPLITNARMKLYASWFSLHLPESAVKSARITGPGLPIDGMEQLPPEDILGLPPVREHVDARIREVLSVDLPPHTPDTKTGETACAIYDHLLEGLSDLDFLLEQGLKALEAWDGTPQHAREIFSSLERVDGRIYTHPLRDLVGFLLQDIVDRLSDEPALEHVLGNSRILYQKIREGVVLHRTEIERAREMVKKL